MCFWINRFLRLMSYLYSKQIFTGMDYPLPRVQGPWSLNFSCLINGPFYTENKTKEKRAQSEELISDFKIKLQYN